jgi:hypothetical protein
MKDGIFLQEMLRRGKEAREKAITAFSDLSLEQLNWKASPESWSIGQCLDHLVVSDCLYFPALKKITEGTYAMSFWENWNPLAGVFGKILDSQMEEYPRKKLNAPALFRPSEKMIDTGILDRFHKHLDTLLEYIAGCNRVDIDKIHITSPVSRTVTYSLRKNILILVRHLHRHLNQAIRVQREKDFPAH